MIVDFHTHVFPEAIAEKTISFLEGKSNSSAFTRGTLEELKKSMKEAGVDYCVALSVVTRPSQFNTVNSYLAEINGKDGIISFGGLHPDCDDIEEKLDYIKELGLKGIKLHPDYQDTKMDDPKYIHICKEAIKRDLIVLFHSGWDIGYPDSHNGSVEYAYNLLNALNVDECENAKIVLAHTGGWKNWDKVEELLVGRNVYFDLSFSIPFISAEQMTRIIKEHGSDRILFATDSPWSGQKQSISEISALDLDREDLDAIFYGNAFKLLGL